MQFREVLAVFSDNLFSGDSQESPELDPSIGKLAQEAISDLATRAAGYYDELSGEAKTDLLHALSRLLGYLSLVDTSFKAPKVARLWVQVQSELLTRLQQDRERIGHMFLAEGTPIGRVQRLRLDLSDRHHHGKAVTAITFESGMKTIYKPRDIGIENWYSDFCLRLNELGAPQKFRNVKVLPRRCYGWTEFVAHARCQNKRELTEYYRNAGALLCLLHVLRATDCHFQNLIASGVDPVLVDSEMLFQPRLREDGDWISVWRTGMIPHWNSGSAHSYDLSALGCVTAISTPFKVPTSGAEGIRLQNASLVPEQNVPFPVDHRAEPQAYVAEMIDGFRQTYRFLASHRRELLTQLECVKAEHVRYVLRDTLEYYQALTEALSLGVTGHTTLEPLPSSRGLFSTLQDDEVSSLEQLDIPRFTLPTSSRDLAGLKDCFATSGYDLACQAVERLSEEDMQQQLAYIKLAWSFYRVSRSLS